MANGPDVSALVQWLESEKKPPPVKDLLSAASWAKSPAVRQHLVELAIRRKIRADGWNDAHAAAMSGIPAHFKLAAKRDADFSASSAAGTPLVIAVRNGHADFVRAMIDAGIDVTGESGGHDRVTGLSLAIRLGRRELVELLFDHHANNRLVMTEAVRVGDQALIRRLAGLGHTVDDAAIRAACSAAAVQTLIELGWNKKVPKAKSGETSTWWGWSRKATDADTKRAFFEALVDSGVRPKLQDFADVVRGYPPADFEPGIAQTLLGTVDATKQVSWEVSGKSKKRSLAECALERMPLPIVQLLVERGSPIGDRFRVEPRWPEAEAKRDWLASQGMVEPKHSPREFLKLQDVGPDELADQLLGGEGIFGLRLGTTVTEARALGFRSGTTDGAAQSVWLASRKGTVSEILYTYTGVSRAQVDAVRERLTEKWGAPIGTDVPRWNHPHGVLKLELDHDSLSGVSWLRLRMAAGKAQRGRQADNVAELAASLSEHLRDISADVLDSGSIERIDATRVDRGLRLDILLENTDRVAVVDWADPPLDENGGISEDLVTALIAAAGNELRSSE